MRAHPYGDHAALLLVEDEADALAWLRALEADPPPGTADVVPGARSVLVVGDGEHGDAASLVAALEARTAPDDARVAGPGELVEIAVDYDGDDLAEVAARAGVGVDEVAGLHSGGTYEVAFCGFSPGFAYLSGTPGALHLPRRPTPRPRVPAGSVAIAAGYSAVYPQDSPGGWWLLGRTDVALFDATREAPALLRPGMRVRFVPVP